MNTRLLRMALRGRTFRRQWIVPGYVHAFTQYGPEADHFWSKDGTGKLSWPDIDKRDGGDCLRSVRMDWHLKMAFQRIREVLTAPRNT